MTLNGIAERAKGLQETLAQVHNIYFEGEHYCRRINKYLFQKMKIPLFSEHNSYTQSTLKRCAKLNYSKIKNTTDSCLNLVTLYGKLCTNVYKSYRSPKIESLLQLQQDCSVFIGIIKVQAESKKTVNIFDNGHSHNSYEIILNKVGKRCIHVNIGTYHVIQNLIV